ncbi:MAG: ADP-ribosylglycohydrolase family protein [Clostridiales bacterium]|nr:ADP-ribosylglycohydrolase family protein [Clostridiales bacterium]
MLKRLLFISTATLMLASCGSDFVEIDRDTMTDKVKGAWAGKMIGVMYGRPMEFACTDGMYTDSIHWSPENVTGALVEDDIYGQMCFMSTLERLGLDAPVDSLAHDFAYAGFGLCHANLQGRKNYLDGLRGDMISTPANNIHCDDIDFQIECDFIGFSNPFMPASSDSLCERVGAVMSAGDGLYGGMYVSALHTMAYDCKDIEQLVVNALGAIPAESGYAQLVNAVLDCYRTNPNDWTIAWKLVNEKWGANDICTPYLPFNIDAKLNGAYIVMGLLYGQGDWTRTMDITVGCGQDTDCNTCNAAAVLGIIDGYNAIPDIYKSYIPQIADELFDHTPYSFNNAVEVTLGFIEQNVERNGGRVTPEAFYIKPQAAVAPAFVPGHQDLRLGNMIAVADGSNVLKFEGAWEDFVYGDGDNDPYKVSTKPGDKLTIPFYGTGIALLGSWDVDGGRARVTVDGVATTIDTYYVTMAGKYQGNRAYLYFVTGLPKGDHTLVMENLEDRNPASQGNKIYFERVLMYE